jgi:hypothetical protein
MLALRCASSVRRLLSSAVFPRRPSSSWSLQAHFAALEAEAAASPPLSSAPGGADAELERVASFAALELPPRGSPARAAAAADLRAALAAGRFAAAYARSRPEVPPAAAGGADDGDADDEALCAARLAELRAAGGAGAGDDAVGAAALLSHAAASRGGCFVVPRTVGS